MCTILTNAETNKQTRAQAYAIENFIFNLCSLILIFFLNDYPFTLSYYLTVQCSKYLPLYPFFFIFLPFCQERSFSSFSWLGGPRFESRQGKAIFLFSKTVQIGSAATPVDIGVRSRA